MTHRLGLAWLLAVSLAVAWPPTAQACPVCVVGPGLTPAQRIQNATRVALVRAEGDSLRTLAVVKGAVPARIDAPSPNVTASGGYAGAVGLVVLEESLATPAGPGWSILGSLHPRHIDWLRAVAAMPPTTETTPFEWRARVAFHAAYLEHPESLLSTTAYAEIARSPYAAIRSLRGQLETATVVAWLARSTGPSRAPLYTLLLGIAGGPLAEARIGSDLATAGAHGETGNLAALLAADLELHGAARLPWLHQEYLGNRRRSVAEVQAALLALSVHGGADARLRRDDVVAAYRCFVRSGHQFAGFPADDLLQWQRWELVPDYLALLRSRALQNPASTFLMRRYLDAAPASARETSGREGNGGDERGGSGRCGASGPLSAAPRRGRSRPSGRRSGRPRQSRSGR